MATSRRRPRHTDDDDDLSLAVVPTAQDDDDDDGDDGDAVDVDEGIRHARRYAAPVDDDEAGADQIIPDRIVPLRLGRPWQHLKLWVWLDYPEEVATLFGPKTADETDEEAGERVIRGLRSVVVKHGGWRDAEGRLPQPGTRTFWERISTPLSRDIVAKLFEVIRRNPTQPGSAKRTRRA